MLRFLQVKSGGIFRELTFEQSCKLQICNCRQKTALDIAIDMVQSLPFDCSAPFERKGLVVTGFGNDYGFLAGVAFVGFQNGVHVAF